MIGPAARRVLLIAVGYWLNLVVAFALVGLAVVIQLALTRQMRPKADPARVPMREIMRTMPPDLRRLLQAEILIRWGDWFARDFAVLYVVYAAHDHSGAGPKSTATQAAGWLMATDGDDRARDLHSDGEVDRRGRVAEAVHRRHVPAVLAVPDLPRAAADASSAAIGLPVMVGPRR